MKDRAARGVKRAVCKERDKKLITCMPARRHKKLDYLYLSLHSFRLLVRQDLAQGLLIDENVSHSKYPHARQKKSETHEIEVNVCCCLTFL
jgi:hypothetical protein